MFKKFKVTYYYDHDLFGSVEDEETVMATDTQMAFVKIKENLKQLQKEFEVYFNPKFIKEVD